MRYTSEDNPGTSDSYPKQLPRMLGLDLRKIWWGWCSGLASLDLLLNRGVWLSPNVQWEASEHQWVRNHPLPSPIAQVGCEALVSVHSIVVTNDLRCCRSDQDELCSQTYYLKKITASSCHEWKVTWQGLKNHKTLLTYKIFYKNSNKNCIYWDSLTTWLKHSSIQRKFTVAHCAS